MEEVLYRFTVAENDSGRYDKYFGKPNECIFEMKNNGWVDKSGTKRSYERSVEDLSKAYITKFKLIEEPKIDLCKIIGVEPFQEMEIKSGVCERYRITDRNIIQSKEFGSNKWTCSRFLANEFILAINNNEIKILPKYELNEHVKWVLEQCLEDGYEWIAKSDEYSYFVVFEEEPNLEYGYFYTDKEFDVLSEAVSKNIPITFEDGAIKITELLGKEV